MTDYEKIVDGLDSVTWYNCLAEYVYRWTLPGHLSYRYELESDYDQRIKDQLEVIWIIAVSMFGDYGTSPRTGWIDDYDGFCKFCNEITKTWQESDEGKDQMKELQNTVEPLCFWCGKGKDKNRNGLRKVWFNGDYEPCESCKAAMDKGVAVVEASETPLVEKQIAYHGAYPTGNWLVMTDEGIRKLCTEEEADKAIERRMVFFDHGLYSEIPQKIRDCLRRKEQQS